MKVKMYLCITFRETRAYRPGAFSVFETDRSGKRMYVKQLPNEQFFAEVERQLSAGRRVVLRAKGNSMLPFIRGGSDSVELVQADWLAPGDILLFRIPSGGNYFLHRLLRVEGDKLWLMGDGNLKGEECCRRKDVIGKVSSIVHADGSRVDCYSPVMRRKVKLWLRLRPLRRVLLALCRRMQRI